jgi:hypothetical protein
MKKKVNPCWFTAAFTAVMVLFNMASLGAQPIEVFSLENTGVGSLRYAINEANSTPGPDEIVFTVAGTINLFGNPLPDLTDNDGVNIRGNTAPGYVANSSSTGGLNGTLAVTIIGSSASDVILRILSDNNTIRGLNFQDPSGTSNLAKIYIEGGSNNLIAGCYIGTNINGTAPDGSLGMGVAIIGGTGNQIGLVGASNRNLISGNTNDNILFFEADGNFVYGNIIGLRADGTSSMGSNGVGVNIFESSNCTVGAGTSSARNIISGNIDGVTIHAGNGNRVRGNYIGMDVTGTTIVAGQRYGVLIIKASSGNLIGGTSTGQGNLISGNVTGVACIGTGVGGNTISGNTIGPQVNGTSNVAGNTQSVGVFIDDSPSHVIGGDTPAERNIISANLDTGIKLGGTSSGTTGTIVQGNYIGLDKNGTSIIAGSSQNNGVEIIENATITAIGGTTASVRNVISGNTDAGIFCNGTNGVGSKISGNFIGTQANGTSNVAGSSQDFGVKIVATKFTIGGNVTEARNIISANTIAGIHISGAGSTGNLIKGNYLGTNLNGTATIPSASQDYGVEIVNSASNNNVGGSGANEGNLISGNTEWGISLQSTHTAGNKVFGNTIGLQANGTLHLPSSQNYGLLIKNSPNNTIGGSAPGERNTISGNTSIGVYIQSAGSTGNKVKGNFIGLDRSGTTFIASSTQSQGIMVDDYASGCIIGGTQPNEGNVISGNINQGIRFFAPTSAGNQVLGNIIGPQRDGVTKLVGSTQNIGIWIHLSSNNTIGGAADGAGNIIAFHATEAVVVEGASSTGNRITNNSFFCNSETFGIAGIWLKNGGNNGMPTPAFTQSNGVILGTTLPNAIVDVYLKDDVCGNCEGINLIGSVTANGGGGWSFTVPDGGAVTATATLNNNTSQFFCRTGGGDANEIGDRVQPSIDTEMISIYPNPSNGTFQIVGLPQENALKQSRTGALAVYNAVGERVHQSEISQSGTEINLDVPPGLYFYVLTSEGQAIKNGKIIIQ